MLQSMNSLRGYILNGTDGKIGKVHDVYFDDQDWSIRYFVVNTGNWLVGQKVLISPHVAGMPNHVDRRLEVSLTRDQIESSPSIHDDEPVSKQREAELASHYGWMTGPVGGGPSQVSRGGIAAAVMEPASDDQSADPHLRAGREVIGYRLDTPDGGIGRVEDILLESDVWDLRYLLVGTGGLLATKSAVIARDWISGISWHDRNISVDIPREKIESAPKFDFDLTKPIDRSYEEMLFAHYGRPVGHY